MNADYEKLVRCTEYVKSIIGDFVPDVALILGTGLNGFADELEKIAEISYRDIDGFPVSTVQGHAGKYIFGKLDGVNVVCMQGRVHYYEGYSMKDIVLPTRLMGLLGAKVLFLTNSAGALNRDYHAGEYMLLRDHISFFVPNPLIGQNMDELGPRFPDMTHVYDEQLRSIIRETARSIGMHLNEGVYVMMTGPSFETPEEVRFLEILGADAVGMSTVPEAIAANHMGMRVCCISSLDNMGAGIKDEKLVHQPGAAKADFVELVRKSILNIAASL